MPDREKVMKGLEICSEHGSWHGLDCEHNEAYKDCPYRGCETGCVVTIAKDALALIKAQDKENEKHQAVLEQYDMALELLKDLEPVRPIRKKEIGAYHSLYCACGNCGAWLLDGQKFCDECGRKAKWE